MDTPHRAEVHKLIDEMSDEQLLDLKQQLLQLIQENNLQGSHWAVKLYSAFEPTPQKAVDSQGTSDKEVD